MFIPKELKQIASELQEMSGAAILVGGAVRDHFLKLPTKDYDVEVFGISSINELENVLSQYGKVSSVGKSFGILKVDIAGEEYDFSFPRIETNTGDKHTDIEVKMAPFITFKEASKRRDLTINSMGYDIFNKTFLDPFNGQESIKNKELSIVDNKTFKEDPLRIYRLIQFAARFNFNISGETKELARKMIVDGTLDHLPKERVFGELSKLMLKSKKPSIGWELMKDLGIIEDYFPELQDIMRVIQSPIWHPEGDVWVHTMMCVDEMAKEISSRDDLSTEDKLVFMFGILAHDLGKATHTTIEEDGRIRSIGHEEAGIEPTKTMMHRITGNKSIIKRMLPLIEFHVRPSTFFVNNAKEKAIKRLSMEVNIKDLVTFAKVDNFGRTTEAAKQRSYPAGEWLLSEAEKIGVKESAPKPLVQGRDLIKLGIKPSGEFGIILAELFEAQIEGEFSTLEDGLKYLKKEIKKEIPSLLEKEEDIIENKNKLY